MGGFPTTNTGVARYEKRIHHPPVTAQRPLGDLVNSGTEQGAGPEGPEIEGTKYEGLQLVSFVDAGSNPSLVRH